MSLEAAQSSSGLNYPPVGRHALAVIDYNTGEITEIGELGVAATSLSKEPGTGRLISWASGPTPGFYEIDKETGAASLLIQTAPGTDFFDIAFDSDGTLWGAHQAQTSPGNYVQELHLIDLALGTSAMDLDRTFLASTAARGNEWNAFNYGPDGSGVHNNRVVLNALNRSAGGGRENGWNLSGTGAAIGVDGNGIQYWAGADWGSEPLTVTIGSVGFESTATIVNRTRFQTWDPSRFDDDPLARTYATPLRLPQVFHGLALVPEPGSGLLVCLGLGFLIRASRRPRN